MGIDFRKVEAEFEEQYGVFTDLCDLPQYQQNSNFIIESKSNGENGQ